MNVEYAECGFAGNTSTMLHGVTCNNGCSEELRKPQQW